MKYEQDLFIHIGTILVVKRAEIVVRSSIF
jgi:hypothetical protein